MHNAGVLFTPEIVALADEAEKFAASTESTAIKVFRVERLTGGFDVHHEDANRRSGLNERARRQNGRCSESP
jgi:hypothetical protein